jgi:hypothetical protein
MFNVIVDGVGALSAIVLVWCLARIHLSKAQKNSTSDSIRLEDYLQKITHITGHSVYDTFHKSSEEWQIPTDRVDKDFNNYLSSQVIPYYVKDFIRKSKKHIDEIYRGKTSYFADKRLVLFYTLLTLLFWGGAVFLSLYVLPHIMPGEIREVFGVAPH